LRELEQIQKQTFQLLASALGGNPFGSGGVWGQVVDIEENEDSWTIETLVRDLSLRDIDEALRLIERVAQMASTTCAARICASRSSTACG
jgi:hypothetical protein